MNRKNDYLSALNEGFGGLGGHIYTARWIIGVAVVALLACAVALIPQPRVDASSQAFFEKDDAAFLSYLSYRDEFGVDEYSIIMYQVNDKNKDVFSEDALILVRQLTEEIEASVPFVYEVTSLVNAEMVYALKDEILIERMIDNFPDSKEKILQFRKRILSNELLASSLVSKDGRYGMISIEMDRSNLDAPETLRLDPEKGNGYDNIYPNVTHDAIEKIIADKKYSALSFFHSGDIPIITTTIDIYTNEATTFTLISFSLIALLVFIFLGFKLKYVVGALLVVIMSLVSTYCFVGAMGWDIDMMFSTVPSLLIAIAVALCVHLISEFDYYSNRCATKKEAIKETLYRVGAPCMFAALTTSVGFIAMSTSPIKTISHMGIYSAFGVMAALVFSFTFLLVLLSVGKHKPSAMVATKANLPQRFIDGILALIFAINMKFPKQILIGSSIAVVIALIGLSKITINQNMMADFSDAVPIKGITAHIDEVFGVGSASLVLHAEDEGGVLDPEFLKEVELVQHYINQQTYLVTHSISIVDLLKQMNQVYHDDDPLFYQLPESRELIAQYVLLYEMSGGENFSQHVNTMRNKAHIIIKAHASDTITFQKLLSGIEDFAVQAELKKVKVEVTGISNLWLNVMDKIQFSQITGFLLAFTVIALFMCLIFRSVKIGLISMIPNVFPILLVLGIMGWSGLSLEFSRMTVAAIALGIAVDDSIHFVTRYKLEFEKHGSYDKALEYCLTGVGRALTITTLILVVGFSVSLFSVMDAKKYFSLLLTGTIVLALLADFFLMPAVLKVIKPFGPERKLANQSTPRELSTQSEEGVEYAG